MFDTQEYLAKIAEIKSRKREYVAIHSKENVWKKYFDIFLIAAIAAMFEALVLLFSGSMFSAILAIAIAYAIMFISIFFEKMKDRKKKQSERKFENEFPEDAQAIKEAEVFARAILSPE